jgi:hypothetical protein
MSECRGGEHLLAVQGAPEQLKISHERVAQGRSEPDEGRGDRGIGPLVAYGRIGRPSPS